MDYGKPERAQALAADYVTGTLRGPARRRFEALLPGHPALRAAMAQWLDRLLPLTAALQPVPPPPGSWALIEQRLWPAHSHADQGQAARWWRALGFWRAAAGLATTAALALGLLLTLPAEPQAPVVVVLSATDAAGTPANFVASLSADGRSLVTRPVQPVALAADKAFELWAVPPQGAPRSLGLISAAGTTVVQRSKLPKSLLDSRNTAALAVSIEPPGGSTTGAPSGPVVFVGKLQL